jgi:hypothetical protein
MINVDILSIGNNYSSLFDGLMSQIKLIRGAITVDQKNAIYNAEKGYFGL